MEELKALAQRITKLVAFKELGPLYGITLGQRQIRRMVANGAFPKPIRYSAMRYGWPEEVIVAWLAERSKKPAEVLRPPVRPRLARPKGRT